MASVAQPGGITRAFHEAARDYGQELDRPPLDEPAHDEAPRSSVRENVEFARQTAVGLESLHDRAAREGGKASCGPLPSFGGPFQRASGCRSDRTMAATSPAVTIRDAIASDRFCRINIVFVRPDGGALVSR